MTALSGRGRSPAPVGEHSRGLSFSSRVEQDRPYNSAMRHPRDLPPSATLALARLHPLALGTAMGTVSASWVFGVTAWTALAGTDAAQRALALLAQYLPGYRVSPGGAVTGLLYAFGIGFAAGFMLAMTRNAIIRLYLAYLRRRAEQQQLSDILDRLG